MSGGDTDLAPRPGSARQAEPVGEKQLDDQPVLRIISKMLIPYMALFGFYVIAHGEVGPGGGFQGGVILASAHILYCLVHGKQRGLRVLPRHLVERAAALGVTIYCGVGVVGLFRGHAFLDYRALASSLPTGEPLGMTLVETGVALTVAAVMITVYLCITEAEDEEEETP